MVDSDDLQLQCDILREPVRQGEGSISVNVKDTAHSVFEIVGVKELNSVLFKQGRLRP